MLKPLLNSKRTNQLLAYTTALGLFIFCSLHYIVPSYFMGSMPPYFPLKYEMVMLSGWLEFFVALGLIYQPTRQLAGWGLIILLFAVFPTNIYVIANKGQAMGISPLFAWLRMPLQIIFLMVGWYFTRFEEH